MPFHPLSSVVRRPKPLSYQGGAVAIVVGITIAVLIGFLGLALDTGKLYVAKSELQNSADACALAAAQALTGVSETQLAIAEAAGMTTGGISNVLFQAEPIAYAANDSVEFSQTLSGVYFDKASISPAEAVTMKFVRCTVERADIPTWFMQVLNVMPGITIAPATVRASAVATRVAAQTNCALPVALCSTAVNPLSPPPLGTWIEGAIGPSGGAGLTGNFKWIDFTPPAGGASELGEVLTGPGTCNLPSVGAEVGQPGNVSSAANDWNSRFGIYQGNVTPAMAIPDFTGYAYTELNWPAQSNAYDDFRTQRTANASYQGDDITGLNTNGTISSSTFLASNGSDRRLAITPIVDCAGFVSGSTAPVVNWACVLMLHPINFNAGGTGTGASRMFLEYHGLSSDPASPCASLGTPGEAGTSQGPQVPVLVQ